MLISSPLPGALACRPLTWGESEDPIGALTEAIKSEGPCLIHVPIGRDEEVYPMVAPGGANRDMIGGMDNAKN